MSESFLLPARVECYAGSREEEYPRALWLEGERLEIREILDRWYQGSVDPEIPIAEYFRIRTEDDALHMLRHDVAGRAWYLVVPGAPSARRDCP